MRNFLTKKNLFWVSLSGTIIVGLYFLLTGTHICYRALDWCRDYLWDFMKTTLPFLLIFPTLFICSIVTRKLPDGIFYAWLKFSAFALPVVYFFIVMSPESAIGGGISAAMTVTRGQAALQLSVIYLILSLIFITWKWFTLRKTK